MSDPNILENEAAMAILRSAQAQLEAIGVPAVLNSTLLPEGMTVSLHVASTEYLAVAADVASGHGGAFAHTEAGHKMFALEVAAAIVNRTIFNVSKPKD